MKFLKFMMVIALSLVLITGCNNKDKVGTDEKKETKTETTTTTDTKTDENKKDENEETSSSMSGEIHVVSREVGSGTRGAFTEITKILSKDKDGKEVDGTYADATISNSTAAVLTTVKGDKSGIGYISLGSLNDEVKALMVDGVMPSADTVKSGDYKIARPFNLVYKEDKLSDMGKDFLSFIMSKQGQEIVKNDGCVPMDTDVEYKPANVSGTLSIAGSTSVTPLMEKLVDKYKELNPGFKADIESNGSSAGIKAAIDGICEIGMSSRELKPEEDSEVKKEVIAMDGIAVIVNNENSTNDITLDNITKIFIGEITDWADVK